jgi:hypothetical protein
LGFALGVTLTVTQLFGRASIDIGMVLSGLTVLFVSKSPKRLTKREMKRRASSVAIDGDSAARGQQSER